MDRTEQSWVVLTDPEGNEFCVLASPPRPAVRARLSSLTAADPSPPVPSTTRPGPVASVRARNQVSHAVCTSTYPRTHPWAFFLALSAVTITATVLAPETHRATITGGHRATVDA